MLYSCYKLQLVIQSRAFPVFSQFFCILNTRSTADTITAFNSSSFISRVCWCPSCFALEFFRFLYDSTSATYLFLLIILTFGRGLIFFCFVCFAPNLLNNCNAPLITGFYSLMVRSYIIFIRHVTFVFLIFFSDAENPLYSLKNMTFLL